MLFGASMMGIGQSSGSSSKIITDWFTSDNPAQNQSIFIPFRQGYNRARVSCIAPGLQGSTTQTVNDNGTITSYYRSGNGGDCVSSIIILSGLSSLVAQFTTYTAALVVVNTPLVRAGIGSSNQNLGDVVHKGYKERYYNYTGTYGPPGDTYAEGGGAGGSSGDANLGNPGACFVWLRSSDGAIATAGRGGTTYNATNLNFGGGGSSHGELAGKGLVVVEWGQTNSF